MMFVAYPDIFVIYRISNYNRIVIIGGALKYIYIVHQLEVILFNNSQ